jgi:RNA polymerase sigma factor (sigma-70 family)
LASTRTSQVVAKLHRVICAHDVNGQPDGQVLSQFLTRRDEAAFAVLVRRHGPMVLSVCRRILGNAADADDAFQATFLVLLRNAASLTSRAVLGDWLHGVARRTALHARRTAARRRTKEQAMVRPEARQSAARDDWLPLLDEELGRLPVKYRLAIMLCYLEGATRQEAALRLGCPEGTLASRLARGRALLARRLARHGVAVSAGSLVATLTQQVAPASVPLAMASAAVKNAVLCGLGKTPAMGLMSAQVITLTEGVLKAMLLTKLKLATVTLLLIGLIAAGGGFIACQMATAQPGPPAIESGPRNEPGGLKADADNFQRDLKNRLEEVDRELERQAEQAANDVRARLLEAALEHYRERVKVLEEQVNKLKQAKTPEAGRSGKAEDRPLPVDVFGAGHTAMEIVKKTSDPDAKWMAVRILGDLRYEPAVLLLLQSLSDPHHYVRSNAARALGDMRVAAAAKPLIELLKKEDNGGVIQQTALALGNLRCSNALPALRGAAKHEDVQTRMWVLQAIGRLGSKRDVRFLAGYFEDPSQSAQASAAQAIEQITGVDFGFPKRSGPSSPDEGLQRARAWWKEHQSEYP